MTESLSQISVILLICSMVLYAAAFIAFAMDLARRSAHATASVPSAVARRAQEVAASNTPGSAHTTTLIRGSVDQAGSPMAGSVSLRTGYSLTVLAFIVELGADIFRGIAAGRVPWANMYEFSMTGTLLIVGVFLVVTLRYDLRFLGSFVTGLVLILLGISSMRYYVEVAPLPPALQSYWLVIHVMVAIIATDRRQSTSIAEVPGNPSQLRHPGEPGVPDQHRRFHPLDLHANGWRDLGRKGLGALLGVGHQGSVDLHHLGRLRRLHPRARHPAS